MEVSLPTALAVGGATGGEVVETSSSAGPPHASPPPCPDAHLCCERGRGRHPAMSLLASKSAANPPEPATTASCSTSVPPPPHPPSRPWPLVLTTCHL
ncbi:hypothetical protein DAI22_12g133525 [Oryza sativa Japonica Group]|nr:hypothetical protein DAI22_12g133525 [Oryza sativa Japonica Group]